MGILFRGGRTARGARKFTLREVRCQDICALRTGAGLPTLRKTKNAQYR